jgi:hypothetical protein
MPIEEFTDKTEMLIETLPATGFVPFTTASKSIYKKEDTDADLRKEVQPLLS